MVLTILFENQSIQYLFLTLLLQVLFNHLILTSWIFLTTLKLAKDVSYILWLVEIEWTILINEAIEQFLGWATC